MATYVLSFRFFVTFAASFGERRDSRAASKDLELESAYLKLLKDSSAHEKAITRDLGRSES